MMKDWKHFEDECNRCGGNDIRVLTSSNQDNYAYDGDDAECLECGLKGSVCVDDENEDGEATGHISWDDLED